MTDEVTILFGFIIVLLIILTIYMAKPSKKLCKSCGRDPDSCACRDAFQNHMFESQVCSSCGLDAKFCTCSGVHHRRDGEEAFTVMPTDTYKPVGLSKIDLESQFGELYGEAMHEEMASDTMAEGVDPEHFTGRFRGHTRHGYNRHLGSGWKTRVFLPVVRPEVDPYLILPEYYDADSLSIYARSKGTKFFHPWDPTPADDLAHGFEKGDVWRNTLSERQFVLTDASTGYAKWIQVVETAGMHDRITRPIQRGVARKLPKGGVRTFSSAKPEIPKDPLSDVTRTTKKQMLA
jgi:hypothetical protein